MRRARTNSRLSQSAGVGRVENRALSDQAKLLYKALMDEPEKKVKSALMRDYKAWWDERVNMLGDRYHGCDRVFLAEDGDRLHPCTFRTWLKKVTKRHGLPDINIHSLRHTNITLQILAGVPLKTVSVRAGHSTTKLTTDTYWQYFKGSDREAARTLDNIFQNNDYHKKLGAADNKVCSSYIFCNEFV